MAKVTRFELGDVIFNVDHSVGRFGRNLFGDVQLVQFLLNRAFENIYPSLQYLTPGIETLVIDGICGSKTRAAILAYQKFLNAQMLKIPEDATVNSADDMFWGPDSDHWTSYTIYHLNQECLHDGKAQLKSLSDIPVAPLRSTLEKWVNDIGFPKKRQF